MADIVVQLDADAGPAIAALQRLDAGAQRELRSTLQREGLRVQASMQTYPPPPPTSTYRRTRNLGNRWETRVVATGGQIGAQVFNPVGYGPFVQGQETQARVHRGRWLTDEGALDMHRRDILDNVGRALRQLAGEP